MTDYKLRNATNDDFEFISFLEKDCMLGFVEELYGEWISALNKETFSPENYYIAEIDNKPIAYINYWEAKEYFILDKLYIISEFQGCGIGTKLLQIILDKANEKNLSLKLLVLANNKKALKFYLKNGLFEAAREKEIIMLETKNKP